MPALHLFQRSNSDDSTLTIHSPITIAGLAVISLIVFGICLWLASRMYQKRAAAKRESRMGAAFLSVKGLVQENDSPSEKDGEKDGVLIRSKTLNNGFSRQMIDSTVILPEKAVMNPAVSLQSQFEVIPKPFARTPASSAPRFPVLDFVVSRESFQARSSFMSSHSRFSVMSGTSTISTTSGTTRKVRQLFEPVLPDELLPSLGEQLTVVQSFDDGWCVVGRANSTFIHTAKSLFKPSSEPDQNIELGVVPAWCFLKPVKGLRAERPIRSTSLGVTINMDGPANTSRNELVSWSNF